MTRAAERARRRADAVSRRLSPARLGGRVSAARARFIILCASRDAAIATRFEAQRARLARACASLDALSPLAVLRRGYALAEDERGKLLRAASDVRIGEAVNLRLAEGRVRCRVEEVESN
jgi:exodeoxyribonuclease VII large subunit